MTLESTMRLATSTNLYTTCTL